MEIAIQGLLFLGIIPALILLFIGLKGYDGIYKDKSVFLTFVIGIVFGVVAAIVRFLISPLPSLVIGYVNAIVYAVLFAFFEQLFKTIVLNLKRLQGKKETTIYGLSLGLGFGSSFTPFLVIAGGLASSNDLFFVSLVAFGSLGFILMHAATSTYIGFGVFKRKLIRYLLIAILIQIPFNYLAEATRYYSDYHLYFQISLVIYGAILFWYVLKNVMPNILKDEKRKRSKKV
jgi:uncharacterized membrane protein